MATIDNRFPTEGTQIDIEDALRSIATAVSGITHPDAEDIAYDNSGSGLSATDVQNALDEIVSDIPTVNNGTLTIQQNGTSIGSFSANTASNVTANIKTPTADKKTATSEFSTADGGLLSKCIINLEPVQSGSGDPYPAGGGKNKFRTTANNETIGGITYSVNDDGSVSVSGTRSSALSKTIGRAEVNSSMGSVTVSGLSDSVNMICSYIRLYDANNTQLVQYTSFRTIDLSNYPDVDHITVSVKGDADNHTVSGKVTIQIELGSTATSWSPYSNVRPISGHTEVDLFRCGKNKLPHPTNGTYGNVVVTTNNDGSVSFVGNCNSNASVDFYRNPARLPDLIERSKTYTVSLTNAIDEFAIYYSTNGSTFDYTPLVNLTTTTTATFTVPSNITGLLIRALVKSGTNYNVTIYPQIEKGNQPTSYEPYLGYLYQVSIGSTVYGGYVDLVSGVMTVDRKYKKGFTRGAIDSSGKLYKIDELSDAVNITSSSGVADLDESNMGIFLGLVSARASADFCLAHFATSFYVGGMVGKETELDALLPNLEIVYELATPQTIQLTPQQIETLAGQNNLSTPLSGQSIETNGVEYKELFTFADVKKIVVPISMLGTDESGRTTASRAYTTGEFFYMDGKMYKVLTSIASGATFTVGTNISETTLFAELTALA